MGYRNRLCQIKKELFDKEKLKDFDYRHDNTEELIELGKYIDYTDRLKLEENIDDDGEYCVMDKSQIVTIINIYAEKHLRYLELIKKGTDGDKPKPEDILAFRELQLWEPRTAEQFLDEQIELWKEPSRIYNTNIDCKSIVESWSYEYEIFELLHIYKTFDDTKYYLIWSGW